ncbi:MAG: hypothetical protein Hals2KO_16190 [Halioglobus sp.]
MIINGLDRDGETFEADVCIAGAGAAGLTLALHLAEAGVSVILIESGGLKFAWRTHKLLDVIVNGASGGALLAGSRERFFGGTTNHWGGVCRAFDAYEFEQHPWVPHSGWPITRADLDPYYAAAAQWLGLPEVDRAFDPDTLQVQSHPPLIKATETAFSSVIWRRVPADRVQLGVWQRDAVARSQRLTCVVNTSVAELHTDPSGKRVVSVEGRNLDGKTLRFRARDYVLCTGDIENARLLLASDSVVPGGLGNEHDVVGRYFMSHEGRLLGFLMGNPALPVSREEALAKRELVGWATSPAARREHRLRGMMAFLQSGAPRELEGELALGSLQRPSIAPAAVRDSDRRWSVLLNMEQSPNPQSRVTLSQMRDVLGVRKPALANVVPEEDMQSLRRSAELLALAVARSGLGRLQLADLSTPKDKVGGHQMGTTRMSSDPRQGVTNADARVHSVENLFVGGGSLFPTSGWQHPTFTIITLAIRLADHLAKRHQGTA